MNRYTATVVTVVALLLFPTAALAGLLGPSNYDECILENMKGIGDRTAASAIVLACRSKFPEKKAAAPRGPANEPAGEGMGSVGSVPQKGGAAGRFTDFQPDNQPPPKP